MVHKEILYVTTLIIGHCFYIGYTGANEVIVQSDAKRPGDDSKIYEFKNKEILQQNEIPELILIKPIIEQKYDSLKGFIDAWDAIDHERLRLSAETPFTIIAPKIDVKSVEKERLREFLLEHLVPGEALHTFNEEDVYGNCNKRPIAFKYVDKDNESQWTLNGFKILRTAILNEKSSVIYIDGILGDRKATTFSKRNIQETNKYNEPQRLEWKNATKEEQIQPRKEPKYSALMTFLAGMKSGTKVFQHFLTKSNLTQVLEDSPYTILIPSDNAFQRWHPIDWGFYPFSVSEFTESVLRNHFLQLKTPVRMEDVRVMDRGQKYKTLGGEVVVFKNNPVPSVNNVSIIADYTLPNGNEVFVISEVLFVSEAIVSRLHQMHKDKETPPLLAFPWFGAQFLSHSFLALERDNRFTQITRFLNNAEVAPFVSGANYTFFVPVDEAFERIGLDRISDESMSSELGVKLLLHHFVKGRLYDKDLKHDEVFETIGGGAVKIQRLLPGNVTVNNAHIIETEVFVYNLGTMFYIDEILYPDIVTHLIRKAATTTTTTTTVMTKPAASQTPLIFAYSTVPDVEPVPSEITESSDGDDTRDVLLHEEEIVIDNNNEGNIDDNIGTEVDMGEDDEDDGEFVTPRALPLLYGDVPKK